MSLANNLVAILASAGTIDGMSLKLRSRRLAPCIGCLLLLFPIPAIAQRAGQAKPSPAPFNSFGFTSEFEKMFDQLLGNATPQEEQDLAEIKISFREESTFGGTQVEAFLADLHEQGVRVTDKGRDVDYLRRLVETLRPMMTRADRYDSISIYVVNSPNVDARSFPGGTLFFYRGLLAFAETEAALIGIVGHELSHLDRQHQLLPLKRTRLLNDQRFEIQDGFDHQKFLANGSLLTRLAGRPFRPQDEAAADRDGAEWSFRAGYDPQELSRLFERLQQRNLDLKIPFASMFRSHPYNEDRRNAIREQSAELQRANPRRSLYRGRKNLASRTTKSQQEFPE